MTEPRRQRNRTSLTMTVLVLLPLAWLALIRITGLEAGEENSLDAYYHVAMADSFPESCMSRQFPQMTLSIWADHFYDKELLFHAGLALVRSSSKAMGASQGPPFHLPALIFAALVLAAMAGLILAYRVPWPLFWVTLFVLLAPHFTFRLLMLRPHVLAIAGILLFVYSLGHVRRPAHFWIPLTFGFLFSYSYSNPHFLLLPAVVFGLLSWRRSHRLGILIPIATLAGVLLGLTLHPQFPNTFIIWKIQSLAVVQQAILRNLSVVLGTELGGIHALPWQDWIGIVLLAATNAGGLALLLQRKRSTELPVETLALFLIQMIAVAGMFLSKRAMEYACPFTVVSAALITRDLKSAGAFSLVPRSVGRIAGPFGVLLLAAGLLAVGAYERRSLAATAIRPFNDWKTWSKNNLPAGTKIANLNWSDFPLLFHASSQYRYLVGLDPMFGYYYDADRMTRLELFRTGRHDLTPSQLRDLVDARFAFVSRYGRQLTGRMSGLGYTLIYQSGDGWLFDLTPGASRPKGSK